jgi:hypothetical protein
MKTPSVKANSAAPTNPILRAKRDAYFDGIIGNAAPLTVDNASSFHVSEGSYLGTQPEMPQFDNRVIVIGQFTSYESVLSGSRRSIYTEAKILLSHVFEDASNAARSGGTITVAIPGGSVSDEAGHALSYLTDARRYFITPGRTYLMMLQFEPEGQFYRRVKEWDLTDGTVRANSGGDHAREVAGGRSAILGLTVNELVRSLTTQFPTAH